MSKFFDFPILLRRKITPVMVIPLIVMGLMFATLMYFNRHETCTASDLHPTSPSERTYSAFFKSSACEKALAVCTYYSRDPKNCKVIK